MVTFNILLKKYLLAFVTFCCTLPILTAQNLSFYKCDSIIHYGYYIDENYENLLSNWKSMDLKELQPSSIFQFAEIALNYNDIDNFLKGLEYIVLNYGFNFREYNFGYLFANLQNIVGQKQIEKLDTLLSLWSNNNISHKRINIMLDDFISAEHEIYQHQRQYDSTTFLNKIDSLFDALINICELQGDLPNQYENGYKYNIEAQILNILSVFPTGNIERCIKLKPFLDNSFFKGEISNSIYFLIDICIYGKYKKQLFGSLDENIAMIDSDIDISYLKSKYFFETNRLAIELCEKRIKSSEEKQ
jgi:hypothetical protein